MTLEDQLTTFRENWEGMRVTVKDDSIFYAVAWGYGGRAARRANKLIETLNLNLIAESSTEGSGFFTVKLKNNEANKI